METDRLARDAVLLQAKRRLGGDRATDYVSWAVDAMVCGCESPALTELAGADLGEPLSLLECADLFRVALRELGIQPSSPDDAVREYVRELARAILDGRVDPVEQVERIHREVVSPLEHPPDLLVWCYLGDRLEPEELTEDLASANFVPVSEASMAPAIIRVARWVVQGAAAEQADAPDRARS
jgi:hypothetical protein